ncbi:MAG: redoxin domain-containing protein [Candidatus Eisenbacteria bacterium]|nr:redoxin domain-containing protein [Candidatus Eisenbacteria bacterium]
MRPAAGPEIGQPAPEIRLKGRGGQFVTLSEFRGKKNVVLVFYPLAFSGVCSHQLPTIERDLAQFEALNAAVLGISVDSHFSNTEFADKLKLTFPLLSDFKREVSMAYGVLLDTGYSGRAIFVVDREGRLAYRDVSQDPGNLEQAPSNARAIEALKALT